MEPKPLLAVSFLLLTWIGFSLQQPYIYTIHDKDTVDFPITYDQPECCNVSYMAITGAGSMLSNFTANNTGSVCRITTTGPIDFSELGLYQNDSGSCMKRLKTGDAELNNSHCKLSVHLPLRTSQNQTFRPYICDGTCSYKKLWNVTINETTLGVIEKINRCDLEPDATDDNLSIVPAPRCPISLGIHSDDKFFYIELLNYTDYDIIMEKVFNFTLVASNWKNPSYTNNSTLMVEITDVDDLPPKFTEDIYTCNIAEGVTGVTNCSVDAKDGDKGINDKIYYKIVSVRPKSAEHDYFMINNATGKLELKRELDREKEPLYYLHIQAFESRNPNHFADAFLVINVTDIDDHRPIMLQHYNVSIVENLPKGSMVTIISASDQDIGENAIITYSLETAGNLVNGAFEINNSTGIVTVNKPELIDRETNPYFALTVFAQSSTKMKSNASLFIRLVDENDNSPVFNASHFSINITETAVGIISQITATDPDQDENGKLVYSFVEQVPSAVFSIDPRNGSIYLNHSIVDIFEEVYHITVKAEDQAINATKQRSSRSSVIPVTIYVADINNNDPKINSLPKNISIPEDLPTDTILLVINATDKDPTDNLKLSLLSSTPQPFKLDGNLLKINGTLDREATASYQVIVQVSDGVHIGKEAITVTVLDINDNVPVFNKSVYNFTVEEENKNSKALGKLTATDVDVERNSRLTYFIDSASPWASNFTVNNYSGEVIPRTSLDREALSQPDSPISFTVFVQDGGVLALTSTTVVHITILDINDHIPTFIGEMPDKLTFDELTPPQDFLTVMATDPDHGNNGKVVYAISSNAPDIVKINQSSGTLLFAQQLVISEHCNNETIIVNISACNPGSPRLCSYHYLKIYIRDVDNHIPQIFYEGNQVTRSLLATEGPHFNRYLSNLYIQSSDDDCLQENKKVFYWVDEATHTILLNGTSMTLYASRDIDADPPRNDSVFNVTVYASNDPYNTTVATSLTTIINVRNVFDSAFVLDRQFYLANVSENTPIGDIFFNMTISSPDLENWTALPQLSLQEETMFSISPSGSISVNGNLNYETQQHVYYLNVEMSTARMEGSVSCVVEVHVTNVNDNSPQFLNQTYVFGIEENNLPSTIVGQVSAIDADHDNLTYDIVGHVTCYSINSDSGIITAVDSIDLENNSVICPSTLKVMVVDGLHNDTASVMINVIPVNDNSPIFANQSYTWNITENTDEIFSVQAEDADCFANRSKSDTRISYSITEKYQGNVTIRENKVTVSQLDLETLGESGTLQFTVLAVDNGSPQRTGAALVTIRVQGTNDNPPIYSHDVTHLTVYLNEEEINPHIFQSHATDADIGPGSEIFYHLLSTTFSINATTGILSNDKPIYIDKSNNNTINITIEASNSDTQKSQGTAQTAIQHVTIIILDVNNHRPELNQSTYTANVSECLETGKHILSVNAVDPDPTSAYNTVRYWLDPRANESDLFKLDTMTGELVLLHTLDVDLTPSQATLTFKVYASDLDGFDTTSNHTHSSNITISVSPCNDNAPVFSADHYNCTIMISQRPVDFHCNVSATDVDKDHIFYTLESILTVDGGPWFGINTSTGQVSLQKIFSNPSLAPKSLLYKVVANDTLHAAEALLIISLVDVNDVTPQFEKKLYKISVKESYPVGMLLNITIAAIDSDIMDKGNLMYEIYFSAGNVSDVLKMDSRTAQPYLLKPLDYDDSTPHEFNVTIKVNDTAGHVNSTILQVTILDVNDNAPKFTENEYTFTLPEGKTVLGQNFSVNASDADNGFNAQLTYNITMWSETEMQSYFNITQKGYVQIVKPLDREDHQAQLSPNGSAIFELIVTAQDHGEPPLSASTKVVIVVTDVNDCVPTFTVDNYSLSVEESSNIGLTIATITATDCDANPAFNNVTYTMSSTNSTDKFNITSSGNIVVNSHLSYKVNGTNVIHFEVEASDGHNNNKTTVTINVLDTNDHSPVFGKADYYFKVNETDNLHMDNHQSFSLTIGQLEATDADEGNNGQLVFEITSGNENDTFFLNQVGGLCKLQTNKSLDHETTKQYILTVTATDSAEIGNRSTVTIVTVEVLDRNDHRPVFNQQTFRGIVMETSPANTSVVLMPDISVSDADSLWFGTQGLRYSLNPNPGPFAINPDDGTITVLSTNSLKRTQNSLYSFQIVVKDSNGTGWNDTAQVNITVIGLRDIYQFNVSELEESLSVVGNVSAIDADIDNGYSVIYSLERDTGPPRKFIIDAHSGDIRLAGKLDRENITDYNLTAVVRYGNISDRAPVLISVIDVNDNAPQISGIDIVNIINVDIVEQQPAGPLYTVSATDLDQIGTNNSKISFSIPTDLDSIFYINEHNGTIFTRNPLDREIQSSYLINVTVTDHGLPPLANFAIINVTVLDINDNYPSFYSDKEENITSIDVYIVEKSPVESVIAIVRAHDPDAGINGTIEFKIGNSKAEQYFKIGNATGQVIIAKMIDISNLVDENLIDANETDTALLIIYVLVQDKAKDPKNASLIINIHVEKINDNAPFFTKQVFHFNVKEEQNATVIGNCTAKIANATNPHMKFFLIDQDDQFFTINEQTGELSTTNPIDREKNSDFMFSVKVSDNRTPERVAFTLVKVNVEDINDNSPEFINTNLTLTVMEEQLIVETVVMKATDKDVGSNANVTYSLGQHDSLPIEIDSISGILTINGTFDREKKSNFDIVVIATDGGSPERNSTMTIPLVVQDANDHPPVFHLLQNIYHVSESTAYPHEIFIVNTTDKDEGWNARVIYSLFSTDGGPFDVDPFNGSLLLTGPLDYETRTSYHVVIIATDEGNPPLSSNKTVVINVTDTYDFMPHFSKDVYEINVPWNMSKDSPILDLNATDELVTYTLSDNDKTMFRINATTGKIFIKSSLNQHEKYYIFNVTATDKQNQTATCRVIVFVDGHFAVFPKREYSVDLEENKPANILIDLNTTEELAGQTVLYSIVAVQPKDDGAFIISSNGVVSCVKELDRELQQQYILYISAVVQGHTRKRRAIEDNNADLLRLVVEVKDINDNAPSFPTSQKKEFWVPFTAQANFIVTTLKAEDRDTSGSEGLNYKVTGGSIDVFAVDYATGELRTIVAIASTYKESFALQIVATDGDNFDSTTLNITIRVLQRKNQVLLTASASLEHFKANQDFFLSNMSRTLGVTVELDSLQPHTVVGEKFDRIELDKVDLTFHALNNSNGEVINAEELLKLMNDKQNLLSELFSYEAMEVQRERTLYDPSAITATQIGLICIAIFILFGSSIALVVLITSSSKYEEEWEEIRKLLKENDQQELELELDTLRSHQSKHPSACRPSSQSVITEAYLETQFNTNESDRPADHPKPKTTAYEEQEVMMEFAEEPLPGANDIPGTKSTADSGVGNTIAESIIASSESARNVPPDLLVVAEGRQGEAPAMTSSPRLARSDENYIQLLDVVETETVDDENEEMSEINEEELGEGVKGSEENKDKAKGPEEMNEGYYAKVNKIATEKNEMGINEEMNEGYYAKVNKIATEKNEMGINDDEVGKKDKENPDIVLPDHSDSRDGPFYEEIITSL